MPLKYAVWLQHGLLSRCPHGPHRPQLDRQPLPRGTNAHEPRGKWAAKAAPFLPSRAKTLQHEMQPRPLLPPLQAVVRGDLPPKTNATIQKIIQ